MDFTDLIAVKIKELMKEKNISIYKLESLTCVYTSTISHISQFLIRKAKTILIENLLYILLSYVLLNSLISFFHIYSNVFFVINIYINSWNQYKTVI